MAKTRRTKEARADSFSNLAMALRTVEDPLRQKETEDGKSSLPQKLKITQMARREHTNMTRQGATETTDHNLGGHTQRQVLRNNNLPRKSLSFAGSCLYSAINSKQEMIDCLEPEIAHVTKQQP